MLLSGTLANPNPNPNPNPTPNPNPNPNQVEHEEGYEPFGVAARLLTLVPLLTPNP